MSHLEALGGVQDFPDLSVQPRESSLPFRGEVPGVTIPVVQTGLARKSRLQRAADSREGYQHFVRLAYRYIKGSKA